MIWMSSEWLQVKYINIVSPRLERFAWKKPGQVANFRCPFCGDSQKHKHKARGYLLSKAGSFIMVCHNCNVAMPLSKFIQSLNETIYREYLMEKYRESGNKSTKPKKEKLVIPTTDKTRMARLVLPSDINLPRIGDLPETNPGVIYLKKRMIPEKFFNDLYVTDDFSFFANEFIPDNDKENLPRDQRIIIPFRDQNKKIIAIQGRSLDPYTNLRYITLKTDKDAPKIYGLDRFDKSKPGIIVEGPFDSMFLPNSLASGSSNLKDTSRFVDQSSAVFVLDNEPRNPNIIRSMRSVVDAGFKIYIWPTTQKNKDINDVILSGIGADDVVRSIYTNSYSGMEATFRIQTWSKS